MQTRLRPPCRRLTTPSDASALANVTFVPETSRPPRPSGWPAAAAAALLRLAATPLLRLTTAVLSVVAVVLMAGQLAGAWLLVGVLDPAAPRVIEASPPDGARGVTVQPELELRFSASMDAASVEAALEFEPPVPMRYEWQNDATRLLIVPTLPLIPATEYVLRLGRGARDLRGAALSGAPLARRFSTDAPRTMFLNVAANEDTAVGGSSGLAYPPIVPDIEQVSNIEQETYPPAITPSPPPSGNAGTTDSSPTSAGTPPPVPLPHAQ